MPPMHGIKLQTHTECWNVMMTRLADLGGKGKEKGKLKRGGGLLT